MYIPSHFEVKDVAEIHRFIEEYGFGQLISEVDGRPFSTHLPVMLDTDKRKIVCHLARSNSHAQAVHGKQVLVTLEGPHDYISPSWYKSPGVPTWNYQAVHIYGTCEVFANVSRLKNLLTALTEKYESNSEKPWQAEFDATKLGGIVGVEITIDEIQCKYKLSQNRPYEDRQEVIKQLEIKGATRLARAMKTMDIEQQ